MAPEEFRRKLTAVFSADVVGYSRLMGEDESATVKTLETYKGVMFSLIKQHRGRVVDSPGDNLLAEFGSVVDAVQCAVAVQKELQTRNENLPENRRMRFRIGINLGDVIEEDDRIYGDGVNVAARLEALAQPGGICVSKTAFDHIETKLPLGYEYLGEQQVKNITKPVGAYRVVMEPRVTVVGKKEKKALSGKGKIFLAIAGIVILLGGGFALWQFMFKPSPPTVEKADPNKMAFPLPDKPSIVVLPFANISDDPKQEVFSDGLTEEIITTISKSPNLFVIARNSAFTYKGKPVKIKQVSEDLGVRYVLEGSVRREGERVRITAQFIDALSGHHLWSERFDRDLKDIFAMQEEIAARIMKALQVRLPSGDRGGPTGRGTKNVEAYLKVMEAAQRLFRYTKEDNAVARNLLEEAVALDPDYPRAYSLLGVCLLNDVVILRTSKLPKRDLKRALEMGQKSLRLDESDAHANSLVAYLYTMTRQFDKAIAKAERALTLDQNSFSVLNTSGFAMTFSGKPEQAIPILEKAIRMDPHASAAPYIALNMAYLMVGRYEDAVEPAKKAVKINPRMFGARIRLAIVYSLTDRDEEARAAVAEILKINPKFSVEEWTKTFPLPIKDRSYIGRFADALRKAGLPDKPPLPLPDKPSIAVLPFTNMSGDPKQDYIGDGLSENIISALSISSQLFVIARNSTFTYKGRPVKVQQVAEELGVQYVLEGSIQKSGDRLRVTAQLIDALTGHHLWSEKYDRKMEDLFDLQDEITKKIVVSLQVELTDGESARIYAKSTDNLEAWKHYIIGTELLQKFTKEDNIEAKEHFEVAIKLDPKFTAAMAWLAQCHNVDALWGWSESPMVSFNSAFQITQQALSINDQDPAVHMYQGFIYLFQRQHENAKATVQRSIDLMPNFADGYAMLAMVVFFNGQFEESIALYNKAVRLNPNLNPLNLVYFANSHIHLRRYEEALEVIKQMEKHSQSGKLPKWIPMSFFSLVYMNLGREEEARVYMAETLKLKPDFSIQSFKMIKPYKDPAHLQRDIDPLRKAGMPEKPPRAVP